MKSHFRGLILISTILAVIGDWCYLFLLFLKSIPSEDLFYMLSWLGMPVAFPMMAMGGYGITFSISVIGLLVGIITILKKHPNAISLRLCFVAVFSHLFLIILYAMNFGSIDHAIRDLFLGGPRPDEIFH